MPVEAASAARQSLPVGFGGRRVSRTERRVSRDCAACLRALTRSACSTAPHRQQRIGRPSCCGTFTTMSLAPRRLPARSHSCPQPYLSSGEQAAPSATVRPGRKFLREFTSPFQLLKLYCSTTTHHHAQPCAATHRHTPPRANTHHHGPPRATTGPPRHHHGTTTEQHMNHQRGAAIPPMDHRRTTKITPRDHPDTNNRPQREPHGTRKGGT